MITDYNPKMAFGCPYDQYDLETNYVAQMKTLIRSIECPVVLFYFSKRPPDHKIAFTRVEAVLNDFPQLVTRQMVDDLIPFCAGYVEAVTKRGSPQKLFNRFDGSPHLNNPSSKDPYANSYYPSPEMHEDAALALGPAVNDLLVKAG